MVCYNEKDVASFPLSISTQDDDDVKNESEVESTFDDVIEVLEELPHRQ